MDLSNAEQLWLLCIQCLGLSSSNIKEFKMPGEDSVNAWHRLHFTDYHLVLEHKKSFVPIVP